MNWILIVLIAVVVIIFLASTLLKAGPTQLKGEYKKAEFLSAAEKEFLKALDMALGTKYRIFAKVRVADIIAPVRGGNASWQSLFNKISAKHVDFLLCGLTNMESVCAIELDDRTHSANSRVERDDFLNHALQTAGVPIARIPTSRNYVGTEILASVESAISGAPAPKPAQTQTIQAPTCPKCGKQMIMRKAQSGANAGHSFWGCSGYPTCKSIVNIIPTN